MGQKLVLKPSDFRPSPSKGGAGAMQRFLAPAASSSCGSAARPATTAAPSSSGSAERPASSKQLSITTIHGVQSLLAEDHVASNTRADAQRITVAVAVLSRLNPYLYTNAEQPVAGTTAGQPGQEHLHLVQLGKPISAAQNARRSNFHSKSLIASAPHSSSLAYSSAARPASKAGGPAELLNLQECTDWLQALPSQEILQNKPLQRLQEVMDLLQRPLFPGAATRDSKTF